MAKYTRVYYHGKLIDAYTRAALKECERRLGYELTIVQGSYNGGRVSASAGTHDGGGVVDLTAYDYQRKVRVLRKVGFSAWYRPRILGLWNAHIHAVQNGNSKVAPSAKRQRFSFKNRRSGLASNGPDNGPWVGYNIFRWKNRNKKTNSKGPGRLDEVREALKANRNAKKEIIDARNSLSKKRKKRRRKLLTALRHERRSTRKLKEILKIK